MNFNKLNSLTIFEISFFNNDAAAESVYKNSFNICLIFFVRFRKIQLVLQNTCKH
jgi:hypothetical protein